jgi:DNA-directed RNA polymerase sigma subunit (sigma70/sigma32)
MHNSSLVARYTKLKPSLNLKQRYFDIFEYRHGMSDGVPHTLAETGEKFGVSGTRAQQIEARVAYEMEQLEKLEA